ncbi:MAG: LysE family transporter [Bacteroidota bacterium]
MLVPFATGVFVGSFLWFLVLTSLAHTLRGKLTDGKLSMVNNIAGATLIVIGVVAVGSTLGKL